MLQKSIKNSIFMLIILATYTIIANYILVGYGSVYYFVVNPLFWIFFIIIASVITAKMNESKKFHDEILEYTLIAAFVNIGIYIFSQLFIDIGKNPYSTTIKGFLTNLYIYILPIIAKEYTRFRIINNVYEKDKKFISIVVTCIYILVDIGSIQVSNSSESIKLLFSDILPTICINILCTYIAMSQLYKPAIYYRAITYAYWIISPILPKVSWVMTFFIDTVIPIILIIYIRYLRKKNDIKREKKQVEVNDPKSIIPFAAIIVIVLWFGLGVFPIRPVAIATGSMEKTLMVGDVVILKKCTAGDLEVGDIVQYQKDNFTVIHRVVSKYHENDKCFLITKGDNNRDADFEPVSEEQVIAKEIFSVRYLGLPAVWINSIKSTSQPSGIETGR